MKPTPGKKKTILLGKCIYQANKDNPDIQEMIAVKGCPPSTKQIVNAFHQAGIPLNPKIFENMDSAPGFFMKKYKGRPEFDESFFRIE
jgi:coenzyme F420-reducing hydrogenase gamma subunit